MSKQQFLQENQREGELYAGIVLGKDGQGDHHLFLLTEKSPSLSWRNALIWAESVGGTLPTRQEQLIISGNIDPEYTPQFYWLCETYSYGVVEYAYISSRRTHAFIAVSKTNAYVARAVRRVPIV